MNLKDQLLDLRSAIKSFETEFDSRLDACLQQVSLPWASVLRRGRLLDWRARRNDEWTDWQTLWLCPRILRACSC